MDQEANAIQDPRNENRFFILKVFASYLLLIFLTVAVLDFFLTPKIKETMTAIIEDELLGIARMISLMPQDTVAHRVRDISKELNVRVTLIDPAGNVIVDSEADRAKSDNHLSRPEVQQAATYGQGKSTRFSTTLQETMLYVAIPMTDTNETKGYVRLSRPLVKVSESLKHLYRVISLTLLIIAVPSLVIAVLFSRKIAARIGD